MTNGRRNYDEWSKEELIREIFALKKQKTYGLVWEREKTKEEFDLFINWEGEKTKEEFSSESKDKFPVLAEVKDKEISTEKDKPVNLLIEGDNYHSLAVLNFTHKGMVDVVYIDPPYNTGNKDFKYNDKFVDKEDGYRHSKWLSFMSKRLALAKNVLKETGVIFISIDDNEFSQLKMLCDDIFGDQSYVGTFIWRRRAPSAMANKLISSDHEYLLTYAKSDFLGFKGISKEYKAYSNPDNDPRGDWTLGDLTVGMTKDQRPNQYYVLVDPKTSREYKPNPDRVWAYIPESMKKLITEKRVVFPENGAKRPMLKRFKSELKSDVNPISTFLNPEWDVNELDIGLNSEGTKILQELLGTKKMDYPKPVSLIKALINQVDKKDALVLDFFVGSGTTSQAVLELNKEDKGDRRFIICTNNENEICTEICYPRVRNIIKGYTQKNGKKIDGLKGNLKYFKTDFVEAAPTDKNKRKLVYKCTEMLCIKENAFDKVKDAKKWKIFKNNESHLGIIFDDEYIDDFVKEVDKISGKFNVYVFSHDDSVPSKEFKKIKSRVTLKPIPETILKVYRAVFKNDI